MTSNPNDRCFYSLTNQRGNNHPCNEGRKHHHDAFGHPFTPATTQPANSDERTDWKQWGKDMRLFVDTLENPPVANTTALEALRSVATGMMASLRSGTVTATTHKGKSVGIKWADMLNDALIEASNEAARCEHDATQDGDHLMCLKCSAVSWGNGEDGWQIWFALVKLPPAPYFTPAVCSTCRHFKTFHPSDRDVCWDCMEAGDEDGYKHAFTAETTGRA